MAAMAFGFGLEGCCDRDSTHRCSAEENRVSALLQVQQWERRKLKLPVNRVSEQEELGLSRESEQPAQSEMGKRIRGGWSLGAELDGKRGS